MAPSVFIGYSREDSEAARRIQEYLEAAGIACFRDTTSIPSSVEFVSSITQAIRSCHVYLALFSRASLASKYVAHELHFAVEADRPIAPVMLSDGLVLPDEVKFHIGSIQYLHARPSVEAILPELEVALRRLSDRVIHADAFAAEADVVSRANYRAETDFQESSVLTSAPDKYASRRLDSVSMFSEFTVELEIGKISGPDDEWFGCQFGEPWPGSHYQFLLRGTGATRVARHLAGQWQNLRQTERAAGFRTGNASNTLRVVRRGGEINLFVNGLHAASVGDSGILTGQLLLAIGRGLQVRVARMRIQGIDLQRARAKAMEQWEQLRTQQAKSILAYVARYSPAANDLRQLIGEVRPDRDQSILIVIGSGIGAQLNDGPLAERLREEINQRGRGYPFRWAAIVTDAAVRNDPIYLECPIIAVGGPSVNQLAASAAGGRRLALWGDSNVDTAQAVERAIASGQLEQFLQTLWGESTVSMPSSESAAPPNRPA